MDDIFGAFDDEWAANLCSMYITMWCVCVCVMEMDEPMMFIFVDRYRHRIFQISVN